MGQDQFGASEEYQKIIDKFEKISKEATTPKDFNVNLYCYCGCILTEGIHKHNFEWPCMSCYRLISRDVIKRFYCPNNECVYKKTNSQQMVYEACVDCVNGVNDSKESEMKHSEDECMLYMKLHHNLDIISQFLLYYLFALSFSM